MMDVAKSCPVSMSHYNDASEDGTVFTARCARCGASDRKVVTRDHLAFNGPYNVDPGLSIVCPYLEHAEDIDATG